LLHVTCIPLLLSKCTVRFFSAPDEPVDLLRLLCDDDPFDPLEDARLEVSSWTGGGGGGAGATW
jgi:hypothetical protein